MKARIVQIGNSRGIRIPKSLIVQAGIKDEVDLHVDENRLIISSPERPRATWADAFRRMAMRGDDVLLDGDLVSSSQWDEEGWEWK
jgi:antitoxin MazE